MRAIWELRLAAYPRVLNLELDLLLQKPPDGDIGRDGTVSVDPDLDAPELDGVTVLQGVPRFCTGDGVQGGRGMAWGNLDGPTDSRERMHEMLAALIPTMSC